MTSIYLKELPSNTSELLKLIEDRLGITDLVPSSSEEWAASNTYLKTGTSQQGYFFLEKTPSNEFRIRDTLSVHVSKNGKELFAYVSGEHCRGIRTKLMFKKRV